MVTSICGFPCSSGYFLYSGKGEKHCLCSYQFQCPNALHPWFSVLHFPFQQNTWARYSTLNLFIPTEDSFQELTNKRTLFIYYFHVIKSKLDCIKLCIQLYYNHHSPVCVCLCRIRGTAFREVISRQEHDPLCFTPRLIL